MGGKRMRIAAGFGAVLVWTAVASSALAADSAVTIAGFAFDPTPITIKAGDTVTWTNSDAQTHTATGDGWDTGNVATGQSKTVTFTKAGTYTYVCIFHGNMQGTVVVQAAGGGSNPTTPPTDTVAAVRADAPAAPGGLLLMILGIAGVVGLAASWRRLARTHAARR